MARILDGDIQADYSSPASASILSSGGSTVALPDPALVRDADLSRDGQDLVLTLPDGSVTVIEGYFLADPPPMLTAPDGQTLTPDLVKAFLTSGDMPQYAQSAALNDASPVGEVGEISGSATVTRPDGTTETITLGTKIYEGDIVETEGDGALNIVFVDETSFSVSENARLSIDEYIFDPASESGQTSFSVLRGLFVFTSGLIGRDDPDDVEIETPMGSIGIRGTTIAGNVDTGEITVMEGAIVLRDFGGREMTLSGQFETAKFNPAGGGIVNMGTMSAADVGARFAAIGNVNPTLFSALNRNAESNTDGQGESGSDETNETNETGETNEDAPDEAVADDSAEPGEPDAEAKTDAKAETKTVENGNQGTRDGESSASDSSGANSRAASEGRNAPSASGQFVDGSLSFDGEGDGGLAGRLRGNGSSPGIGDNLPGAGKNAGTGAGDALAGQDTTGSDGSESSSGAGADNDAGNNNSDSTSTSTDPDVLAENVETPFELFSFRNWDLKEVTDYGSGGTSDQVVATVMLDRPLSSDVSFTVASPSALVRNALTVERNGQVLTVKLNGSNAAQALIDDDATDLEIIHFRLKAINGSGDVRVSPLIETEIFDPDVLDLGMAGTSSAAADGLQILSNVNGVTDLTLVSGPDEGHGYRILAVRNGGQNIVFSQGGGAAAAPSEALMSAAWAGDVDGDGTEDFIAGVDAGLAGGAALYTDGTDVHLTDTGATIQDGDNWGYEVAGAGDVNNDGFSDFLISAPDSGSKDGTVLLVYGSETIDAANLDVEDLAVTNNDAVLITGLTAADMLGRSVSAAGDFNNDGYADFIIGAPGVDADSDTTLEGTAYLVYGGEGISNVDLGNASQALKIYGASIDDNAQLGDAVLGGADFNGDGISDVMVYADGALNGKGVAHIIYGGMGFSGDIDVFATTADNSHGYLIEGGDGTALLNGGAAGDFNGDGFDDMVVVAGENGINDIYVIYGGDTTLGRGVNRSISDFSDQEGLAFEMIWDGIDGKEIDVIGAGDINGDGFDDLVFSHPDVGILTVYGRANEDALDAGAQKVMAAGESFLAADQAGQALVGREGNAQTISDGGFGDVSMRAGNAETTFEIHSDNFRKITGGEQEDKLLIDYDGALDLGSFGDQALSGVEKLEMASGTTLSLTIGLDDIYRLLQQSANGELIISGGSNNTLLIDDPGYGATAMTLDNTNADSYLGLDGDAGNVTLGTGSDGNYNVYDFGSGYTLLIERDIGTVQIV